MEPNNLFILHRSDTSEDGSEQVRGTVATLGTAVELMPSVWLVKSEQRGVEAFNELKPSLAQGDKLIVIDATNDYFDCWPEQRTIPDITS